jgi:hypothetical protein
MLEVKLKSTIFTVSIPSLSASAVQGGAVLGGYNPLGFDGFGEQLLASRQLA